MAMQLIPAVDVLDGAVVRLLRGDYDQVTVYADDPVVQAGRWIGAGATLVHVVDLAGARTGRPDVGLWRAFAEAGVPFQVGGGIRERSDAERALAAGAVRVVLGTAAVWDPAVVAAVVAAVGASSVVAALDIRRGTDVRRSRATGAGWRDRGRDVADVVADVQDAGVGRVLVTGIGRDGTMAGPDLELLASVREAAPSLAILASGGVGSLDDLGELAAAGAEGAIVGRALYEERFTMAEAVAHLGP